LISRLIGAALVLAATSATAQQVKVADNVTLTLSGYVHADARAYVIGDDRAADTFVLRRVRPIFDGRIGERFSFRVMPDFGDGRTVLQDAYLDMRVGEGKTVRGGKFKAPFGLERLMSAVDLLFIERGLPTQLVPNRDAGVQYSASALGGRLTYAVAALNGTPDGGSVDADADDGKDAVARVFWTPFAGDANKPNLGLGLAYSTGDQQGSAAAPGVASYRTAGQQTIFSYRTGTFVDGARQRWSPQAHLAAGRVRVIAEYVSSSQHVRNTGAGPLDVETNAWQLAAGFMLTGERNAMRTVKPAKPFDPAAGGFGAVELVARYGWMDVGDSAFAFADPAVSARSAREGGLGVNWILTPNVKLMVNFTRTDFTMTDGGLSRESENAVLARWQLAY
jgi:phosphate-selective porin OprO/OprP